MCVPTVGERGATDWDALNAISADKLKSGKFVSKQSESRPRNLILAGVCQPNADETNLFVNGLRSILQSQWQSRVQ